MNFARLSNSDKFLSAYTALEQFLAEMQNEPTSWDDLPWDLGPHILTHFAWSERIVARTVCRSFRTFRPHEVITIDGFISSFRSLQAFLTEVKASHTSAPIHVRLHDYNHDCLTVATGCPTLTSLHLVHCLDTLLAQQLLEQLPAGLQSLTLRVSDRFGVPERVVCHPAWDRLRNLRQLVLIFTQQGKRPEDGALDLTWEGCCARRELGLQLPWTLPSLPRLEQLTVSGISEHRLSFEGVAMPELERLTFDNDLFQPGPQVNIAPQVS